MIFFLFQKYAIFWLWKIRKAKQKYLILERRNILMRADGVLQISLFSLFIYVHMYVCSGKWKGNVVKRKLKFYVKGRFNTITHTSIDFSFLFSSIYLIFRVLHEFFILSVYYFAHKELSILTTIIQSSAFFITLLCWLFKMSIIVVNISENYSVLNMLLMFFSASLYYNYNLDNKTKQTFCFILIVQ